MELLAELQFVILPRHMTQLVNALLISLHAILPLDQQLLELANSALIALLAAVVSHAQPS